MERVLVLLSTYNGERYLEEQLESIRAQQGVEVKILVRDDGSKDNTLYILKRYNIDWQDLFAGIVAGENVGSNKSFSELVSLGLEAAKGTFEYFAFADQDDYWKEDKLISAIRRLKVVDKNIPALYFSSTTLADQNLVAMDASPKYKKLDLTKGKALARNPATGCTMVFNRVAVEFYNSHMPDYIKVHDHYMFLLCSFMGNVIYDPESHILYRQHGHNQIGGKDDFWGNMKQRRSSGGNLKKNYMQHVASSFLNAYEDVLSETDISLIKKMANYRDSLYNRFKLLFSSEISKEGFEENFFFKLKILIGGV